MANTQWGEVPVDLSPRLVSRHGGTPAARRPRGGPRTKKSTSRQRGDAPLSPLLHGRVRLLIVATLMRRGASSFTDLRNGLDLTDGTLSVHLGKLEEGGVVEIVKGFEGKRPKTVVRMTRGGKTRFRNYLGELKGLLEGFDL